MLLCTAAPTDDGFWTALVVKALEHRGAILATSVFLVLLGLLRALLHEPRRLRFPLAMFALYLLSMPVRAILYGLGAGYETAHDATAFGANLALAFGVIDVCGLFLFNVLVGRLAKMRILRDITSVVAGLVVMFVLLSRAHVNILPVITTSAVLTAVLGLALQDTLGNLLSGLALQIESPMSIGDWISVGDVTGQVVEIRWRSTAIVTRNDDIIVFPNAQLAKSTIVNLSRPYPWHRRWVYFDVHYRHSPNLVQKVAVEALRDLPRVKHDEPAPDCILYGFFPDHMQFAVRYRLLDLRQDDVTDSEVRKRLWYALKRNGIEIPYPSRNLFVTQLDHEREQGKWEKERARRLESLKRVDLLAPLDAAQLDRLAERLSVEVFCAGEVVIAQGAPGDSLYVLRRGEVSVRVAAGGLEREVAKLAEGQFFGEMSLMTGEPRHATVTALGDVECYVINKSVFQEILAGRDALVHAITTLLAKRTAELRGEVAHLDAEAAHAVAARHQDLLQRITNFFGLGS